MLMTPITPKVMASPIAASSSTEPSEMPYHRFCAMLQTARRLSMALMASASAWAMAGGWSAGTALRTARESRSPRSRRTLMASILSASLALARLTTMAARAASSARLTRWSVSLASAASTVAS